MLKVALFDWLISTHIFQVNVNMNYLDLKTNFIIYKEYMIISECHIFNDAIIMYANIIA